jgi:hypothetical protein
VNFNWLAFAVYSASLSGQQAFPVRFAHAEIGRNVRICLDGRTFESAFAGKLRFQDETHSWLSVCADVRSPITEGQFFAVKARGSADLGGNLTKAGNIVARWFSAARTPDQCAGLQIAVWEAIEDGDARPDFLGGRFQVIASPAVMAYAQSYYQSIGQSGNATYLQTTAGAGGGQTGGGGGGQGQMSE